MWNNTCRGALAGKYMLKDGGTGSKSQRGSECIATFPIIPNVSGLFRLHVTALKADGAWPPASAASTAKPLTFPHLGALSLDEYHLSPLTCRHLCRVSFFSPRSPRPFPQLVNS